MRTPDVLPLQKKKEGKVGKRGRGKEEGKNPAVKIKKAPPARNPFFLPSKKKGKSL